MKHSRLRLAVKRISPNNLHISAYEEQHPLSSYSLLQETVNETRFRQIPHGELSKGIVPEKEFLDHDMPTDRVAGLQ